MGNYFCNTLAQRLEMKIDAVGDAIRGVRSQIRRNRNEIEELHNPRSKMGANYQRRMLQVKLKGERWLLNSVVKLEGLRMQLQGLRATIRTAEELQFADEIMAEVHAVLLKHQINSTKMDIEREMASDLAGDIMRDDDEEEEEEEEDSASRNARIARLPLAPQEPLRSAETGVVSI